MVCMCMEREGNQASCVLCNVVTPSRLLQNADDGQSRGGSLLPTLTPPSLHHTTGAMDSSVAPPKKDLDAWLSTWPNVHGQFRFLVTSLQRRKVVGSLQCAKMTIELLKTVMGTCRWSTAAELMRIVKRVGKALIDAQPLELVIGNIVRRILFLIREEHANKLRELRARQGLATTSFSEDGEAADELNVTVPQLRMAVMEAIGELQLELDNAYGEICELALEHIHANEVILTVGRSRTVEKFLREAAERRRVFEVIVAESAPTLAGREMAKSLAAAGIETTVISDSAVYAIMARVNQVLLPCRAMIANGGLIAPCGGHMAALAAKELSVPVVCVTGLFKLSPVYRHDQDAFNDLKSPSALIEYAEAAAMAEGTVDILNPAYDYVPPELVDLYITNTGGHQTSYVYRLLGEYYHHDDSSLD